MTDTADFDPTQFAASAQRGFDATAHAIGVWTETLQAYAGSFSFEQPLPRPAELHTAVGAYFDLATALIAEQRVIADAIVAAGTEAVEALTEQAREAAAAFPVNLGATA